MEISCSENIKKEEVKRKRTSNWVEEDKILLKELVKERVSHIENKNTDTNTNQRKKKAWLELEESFNNLCKGSKRSLPQLKSQWTITKMQAKKEVSTHRMEINKTGGGPQPSEMQPSENDISVWLPNEFIVDSNEFDSDLVPEISPVVNIASPTNDEVKPNEVEVKGGNEAKLKVLPTKPLGKKKMRPIATHKVAEKKITEVVEFDIKCRKELHQLQVANQQRESQYRDDLHHLQVINEKKKATYLDLQYKILKEKYEENQLLKNKQIDTDKDDMKCSDFC